MIRVLTARDAAILRFLLPQFERVGASRSPDEAGSFLAPVAQDLMAVAEPGLLNPDLEATYAACDSFQIPNHPTVVAGSHTKWREPLYVGETKEIDRAINLVVRGWHCLAPPNRPSVVSTSWVQAAVFLDHEEALSIPDTWFKSVTLKAAIVHVNHIEVHYRAPYLHVREDKVVTAIQRRQLHPQ